MKVRNFRVKIAFPWTFVVAVEWIGRDEVDGGLPRRAEKAVETAAGCENEVDRANSVAAYQTGRARPRMRKLPPIHVCGMENWMEEFSFCE